MNTHSLSVVICAYTPERWDELAAVTAAMQAQSVTPREVLVVIDHHRELWAQARQQLAGVRVLENREARGLSGARNTGIAAASGSVIAFIDEDAVPATDWLAQLGASYAEPAVMGAGGPVEPWWLAGRPAWFPEEFDWVVGCTYRGMPVSGGQVRNLIGCNMSFRREVFATLGGFRDGIGRIGAHPVGCEETELCIRARRRWPAGRLDYQPRARVAHRVPAQRGTWSYFRSRCYFEGRSKALVTALTGSQMGLASERTYALQALPRGMARNALEALRHGRTAALARAAAIAAGLAWTTAGYLVGKALAAREGPGSWPAANQEGREARHSLPPDVTSL